MFELTFTPDKQLFGKDVRVWNPDFLHEFLNHKKIPYSQTEEDNIITIIPAGVDLHFRYAENPSFFHIYVGEKNFRIFNENVIGKRKEEIIALFKSNEYITFDYVNEFGVHMLEFDSAGITFFFENQFVDECVIDIY